MSVRIFKIKSAATANRRRSPETRNAEARRVPPTPFRVDHLGFSNYTARFRKFDATLYFDPAKLITSQVEVSVDTVSDVCVEEDCAHRPTNI
jgi:polyisoprenoid-binding protein YceI